MGFTDWDFFPGGGATVQNLTETNPLLSGSSLQVRGGSFDEWHAQLDIGQSRGFDKGRVRTLMRTESIAFNLTSFHPGLFCLSSQEDLTSTGDFYCVIVEPTASANNVQLKKITGGINNITSTGSLATATKDFTIGTLIAIELTWIYNGVDTVLIVKTGDATNYSDLTLAIVTVDASSPLTTGFAEGLVIETDNSGAFDMLYDQVEIDVGT